LDEKMQRLSELRDAALKAIENEREKGLVHSSLEARVHLFAQDEELFQFLRRNFNLLALIFIVSDVLVEKVAAFSEGTFKSPDVSHLGIRIEKIDFPKCQRCWNYRPSVGRDRGHPQLCKRCVEVLELEKTKKPACPGEAKRAAFL